MSVRTFTYILNSQLPPLAWVMERNTASGATTVRHGALVEAQPTCFFEGAWGADFGEGRPDLTEVAFGSGVVLDADGITLVASVATTEPLYYQENETRFVAANSLPLLLATLDDALDPRFRGYHEINTSILTGYRRYEREIPTRTSGVRRLIHMNLRVDSDGVREVLKPEPAEFRTFEEYDQQLRAGYAALIANARDPRRARPFRIYSTQSRGYDTTAMNAIAMRHGLDGIFTVTTGKGGGSYSDNTAEREVSDDGTDIARGLGCPNVVQLERRAFTNGFDGELYYHASISECQDANLKDVAAGIEAPALLLIGTLGSFWYTSQHSTDQAIITDELRRGDLSGNGLAEPRLRAGYVSVHPIFIGGRRRDRIAAITHSPAMDPWRLNTAYDRPIPRRLAEEAGVPREAFGQTKVASVVEFSHPQLPVDPTVRERYIAFLTREVGLSAWQIALIPTVRRLNEGFHFSNPKVYRPHYYVTRLLSRITNRNAWPIRVWKGLRGSLYCFAVNECVTEYRNAMEHGRT